MTGRGGPSLPAEQRKAFSHARWLQVTWLFFLTTIILAMYYALGNSQAMRTAWIEDLLSFVPPIAFLVSSWVEGWPPNERFPNGFVRVSSIGYLVASVSLAGVALFLIYDSTHALVIGDHPTIGSAELLGVTFWFGWVMIAALAYSVVLPVIFGRLKLRPARTLNDKILWADALMNKADWLTGLAAAIGIVGIGFGLWWADAVAAMLIALDVLHDGYRHTSAAIRDLSGEMPRTIDDKEIDPVVEKLKASLDGLHWVRSSRLRLHQDGRFVGGTIFVEPSVPHVDPDWVRDAEAELARSDWRLHDLAIVPSSPP